VRLLLIQGDLVGVYEDRQCLAVYAGATQLERESAEQLRLAPRAELEKPAEVADAG
jgi:hypothetical protein